MGALTDAYLDPDIGMRKADYTRRRRAIEKEIAEREQEAADLQGRIETKTLSQEQMRAAEEFAAEVREGIELLGLEEKRRVLQLLGVQGRIRHDKDKNSWIELEGLFPATEFGLSSITSV